MNSTREITEFPSNLWLKNHIRIQYYFFGIFMEEICNCTRSFLDGKGSNGYLVITLVEFMLNLQSAIFQMYMLASICEIRQFVN